MSVLFDLPRRQAIRSAIAKDSYLRGEFRLVEKNVVKYDWLVATHKGLFAVNDDATLLVAQGWFFGICRKADTIYLFENCALRDRTLALGRLIRFQIDSGFISEPAAIVNGLDANCHQVRFIDHCLCVVDTSHQAILRFAPDGSAYDSKTPFPHGQLEDRSGNYLHLNSIAKVGEHIAIMLHNGTVVPEKYSELAWLDGDWNLIRREPVRGHMCHDIVQDDDGLIWHSASRSGEIIASDGRRVKVSEDRMTRGMAFSADRLIVGLSSFGPRQNRDALPGGVVIFDQQMKRLAELELGAPPADIIAI